MQRSSWYISAGAALAAVGVLSALRQGDGPVSTTAKGTLGTDNATAQRLFGPLEFVAEPAASNPEAIRITNGWDKTNIVTVAVPGLGRSVPFHRLGAERLVALFSAWQSQGLISRILTWDGSWVPRFVRGSKTRLSNHAFGMAFDINARWNGMGSPAAPLGQTGSVVELAAIAKSLGWTWGGDYSSRPDGMHFELNS